MCEGDLYCRREEEVVMSTTKFLAAKKKLCYVDGEEEIVMSLVPYQEGLLCPEESCSRPPSGWGEENTTGWGLT